MQLDDELAAMNADSGAEASSSEDPGHQSPPSPGAPGSGSKRAKSVDAMLRDAAGHKTSRRKAKLTRLLREKVKDPEAIERMIAEIEAKAGAPAPKERPAQRDPVPAADIPAQAGPATGDPAAAGGAPPAPATSIETSFDLELPPDKLAAGFVSLLEIGTNLGPKQLQGSLNGAVPFPKGFKADGSMEFVSIDKKSLLTMAYTPVAAKYGPSIKIPCELVALAATALVFAPAGVALWQEHKAAQQAAKSGGGEHAKPAPVEVHKFEKAAA